MVDSMLSALPKKVLDRFSKHFLSPSGLFEGLDVREGQSILEIGQPIGFFTPAALGKVGDGGNVYVAGPDNESLEKLGHLAHHKNLHTILLSDVLTGKSIPNHSLDLVILTNLLSNSVHPADFCLSLWQYLKPDSQVVLIDWDTADSHVGPRPTHRVSREEAIKLFGQCGLDFSRVLKTPGYHYGLVFSFAGQNDTLETS